MAINKKDFQDYAKQRETDELKQAIESKKQFTHNKTFTRKDINDKNESIISISPNLISNWEYHDRPNTELGDLDSLARDIKEIGQQQPCIVRTTNVHNKYELIVGERRWRACLLSGLDIKVIIKEGMSDYDAALSQAAENDNRVDLSDYAKGISYSKLIENNKIKQKDLIDKLGKSKQYISALLSFSKIPNEILVAVDDWSKVNARLAEKIKQLALKDTNNIQFIIEVSDKIRSGKYGEKSLESFINKKSQSNINNIDIKSKKVTLRDGRHIFTWRNDNNKIPSIHFPQSIYEMLKKGDISLEMITENMKKTIEDMLNKL